jgi:hypothetical protein
VEKLANNKKIIEQFSKPSIDIEEESLSIIEHEIDKYKAQKKFSNSLKSSSIRKNCICCGEQLNGNNFERRNVTFVECLICGHIQTLNQPPKDYLNLFSTASVFSETYPQLNKKEFLNRQNRIYKPKLDWIFSSLKKLGIKDSDLLEKKWVEIGSGAGYFLSAAKEKGLDNIIGLEQDKQLYLDSVNHNPDVEIYYWDKTFDKAIETHDVDIFCSFFVLEHIDDLPLVWKKIKEKPANTLFVFSVPVFGLSCILEEAFPEQYARNLDGVIHTQLFTDVSIHYAMNLADCKILSEWVFGQDASDLLRFLKHNIKDNQIDTKIHSKLNAQLRSIHDDIQASFDHKRLSDQRHFIAVRR